MYRQSSLQNTLQSPTLICLAFPAQEEAAKVSAIASECEADLARAMPAFNAALKALNTLTKNDISEVKGMKAPPPAVSTAFLCLQL